VLPPDLGKFGQQGKTKLSKTTGYGDRLRVSPLTESGCADSEKTADGVIIGSKLNPVNWKPNGGQ